MDILSIVRSIHPDLSESDSGWYRSKSDPKHKDKSLCFNFELMWVKDFRTGYSSSIYRYLTSRGMDLDYSDIFYSKVKKRLKESKLKVKLPDTFKLLGYSLDPLAERALKYMTGKSKGERGIPLNILNECFIGYDDTPGSQYYGSIIFPCFSKGELVYFSARSFLPITNKHRNLKFSEFNVGSSNVIYNSDALFLFDKVYLCEGVIDALTCYPYGVSTYTWKVSNSQFRILSNSSCEILIPFDRGFEKQANNTALDLLKQGKRVKVLNLTNYPGKDVNDWGFELVKQVEKETDYFTLKNMFKL